jgi:hypothetical protein
MSIYGWHPCGMLYCVHLGPHEDGNRGLHFRRYQCFMQELRGPYGVGRLEKTCGSQRPWEYEYHSIVTRGCLYTVHSTQYCWCTVVARTSSRPSGSPRGRSKPGSQRPTFCFHTPDAFRRETGPELGITGRDWVSGGQGGREVREVCAPASG